LRCCIASGHAASVHTNADLRDVITFQGKSVELKKAFAGSIEDYLAFCKRCGEEPEKPFLGQFVVRTDPVLHKDVSTAARRAGVSLNKFVAVALEKAVRRWSHASAI
jgi:predicted HicB family RNase H-like nuclease